MGNFLFQGSNDGKKWASLLEVSRDKATVTHCGWNLAQACDPMRYFRIMMTSPTSSNSRRICMKNLTLAGSLFINGEPYLTKSLPQMQPTTIKQEQVRPSVVHIRPQSGVSSEHVMQICDSSLTNLIHAVANMSWLVSSTQGLAATISSYKIEPPKELLSHAISSALSDIVGLVSVTSDTFLESCFSYLAEMLVELSVGCKNEHIYRLFLFGRIKTSSTPFMKVHTQTRKLAHKLAALISTHNFRNLQFTTTIIFRITSPSSVELQRSKNQMEGIADIARKGLPVSKLPPFDVSSLIEFNLRREVHDLFGQIIPKSLLQFVQLNSESNVSFSSNTPVTDSKDASPDRVTNLEAQLGASLLREHELRAKLHAITAVPTIGTYSPLIRSSELSHSAVMTNNVTDMYDAKMRNLQFELEEAAKREEALKKAPYFGTNPADSFDAAQSKQKLQDVTSMLIQRDKTIEEMAVRLAQSNHVADLSNSSPVIDLHLQDSAIQSMQATIDDLLHQLSTSKSELKSSLEREKILATASQIVHSNQRELDGSTSIASMGDDIQKQVDTNESLVMAAASRDKQVRDLEMQVARLQAKLQESYDEVDSMMSEQANSKSIDRVAELETELEQAALREENLQQIMTTWSSDEDRRRIRDLERDLVLTKRKEEELRNAPPPPIPSEIIGQIRSLEEKLKKEEESSQSLKRKLETTIIEAKERSEKWASTEAELRSACLQWSPEVDRKRILDLQLSIENLNQREVALNDLLLQKPKMSEEEERKMQKMEQQMQQQQILITQLEGKISMAPSRERLLEGEQRIEELNTTIENLSRSEAMLQQNIDTLHSNITEKNSEIKKSFETLEQQESIAKSREEYLLFEISQLKERLPENRDEVIEGLKLVKADSIEKNRSQKAELVELQKVRIDFEIQTKKTLEAEAKIKQLESKSKEQRKLLEAEKAINFGLQSQITELELTIKQNMQQASLQGLPPKAKDQKLEAMMLNSKRTIVNLDKERRAVHEKEKETAKRNQELKAQASKAQERMERAVESEEEMQARVALLSEVTSNEAKVASTIVDSLSVATEQRILALESERDACKLQEQAVLRQLGEMEDKVALYEKTKQTAQANESLLAMQVTKLRKLLEEASSRNSHDVHDSQDLAKQMAYISDDGNSILQTTTVQEYVQSEITRAQIELRRVLEEEFVTTLTEFEARKGDAVHTAFIKADATVVQRIQNFVDEKAEIMKHMTYLTRAHADSNMAAKLAEEKLNKSSPSKPKRDPVAPVPDLKSDFRNSSSALPLVNKGEPTVGTSDSFPRRLLSIGTSPLPGSRSRNAGSGVGFVSEEALTPSVVMSPYASSEPNAVVVPEIKEDRRDKSPVRSSAGTRNVPVEELFILEKKKISKLEVSLKALQEEKVALQVELATQRHLTDVCQQELEFLRKQTKKGFLPRFLDRSPPRQDRAARSFEIQDDADDDLDHSDFRHSRSASGPVQFVLERGSSQKFAGVSINTMKKLNSDDLQRIKAYSPNLFKSDKKKPIKQSDASEQFKSEFNYPKSKFEQLADQWMFDEPSIKKRQEQIMLQEHLQSLKNKAMKQQAVLFAVASKQGVKVPQ
jgi:hypothetical protein